MLNLIVDYSASKLLIHALERYDAKNKKEPVAIGIHSVCLETGIPRETFVEEILDEIVCKLSMLNFVEKIQYNSKLQLFFIKFDFEEGVGI